MGLWGVIKLFGNVIKDFIIDRIKGLLSGITGMGKALLAFFKGDWKQAWEVGKQAVVDLSGVEAGKNALSKVKNGISDAYSEGAKKGIRAVNADKSLQPQVGIQSPNIPGTSTVEAFKNFGLAGSQGNPEASKSTDAVATGGTKQTTINIQLGKFFETINITGKDFRENTRELETQVTDAMLRVLGSAQTAAV